MKINNVGLSIKRTPNKCLIYVLPLSHNYIKVTVETDAVYTTQNRLKTFKIRFTF